jgi:hypothetical protein
VALPVLWSVLLEALALATVLVAVARWAWERVTPSLSPEAMSADNIST